MTRIVRSRAARVDLVDIAYYFMKQGTLPTARRFREQAEATFQRLAASPGMGTRYDHEHAGLADLRYFPVSRFRNYLVFYQPLADGIVVVRVLHGARDIQSMLLEEYGVADDEELEQ